MSTKWNKSLDSLNSLTTMIESVAKQTLQPANNTSNQIETDLRYYPDQSPAVSRASSLCLEPRERSSICCR